MIGMLHITGLGRPNIHTQQTPPVPSAGMTKRKALLVLANALVVVPAPTGIGAAVDLDKLVQPNARSYQN
jgi:hypothetical protein